MLITSHRFIIAWTAIFSLFLIPGCGSSSEDQPKTMTILVAARDIKPGTPLTAALVEKAELPERFGTLDIFTPAELSLHLNSPVLHRIPKGQPIYIHNFEDKSSSLGSRTRPGGRAYTIAMNPALGVGSWMRANDHVDVLATFVRLVGSRSETVSITLLENITVLRVNENVVNQATPVQGGVAFSSVTLLLLPEEVEILHLAQTVGEVGLALRNPDDRGLIGKGKASTLETMTTFKRAVLDFAPTPVVPSPPADAPSPPAPAK